MRDVEVGRMVVVLSTMLGCWREVERGGWGLFKDIAGRENLCLEFQVYMMDAYLDSHRRFIGRSTAVYRDATSRLVGR